MPDKTSSITTLSDMAACADYSFLASLRADPQATSDGDDHQPRQVFSGHYVPVSPTPLKAPGYVAHSHSLFRELGLGFQSVFKKCLYLVRHSINSVFT